MPVGQLKIMRRMAKGEVLLHNQTKNIFYWESNPKERATVSAKALYKKGFISTVIGYRYPSGVQKMEITPTGKNEMGYNHSRNID